MYRQTFGIIIASVLTESQNVQVQVLIKKICNFFNDAARVWVLFTLSPYLSRLVLGCESNCLLHFFDGEIISYM